jgi:glycosyltransferase involved in cell wall biosynthesis
MKISVALCTYNGEKYVAEQLDSILNQSIHVDEIVICDDGSTDKTGTIIREYQQKYHGIFKIFSNEKNIGYTKNFEKAIGLCSGDLIFLCDQDDIWKLNKVEVVKQAAELNPQKNIFAHRIEILESNGKTINQSFWDIDNFNPNSTNIEILQYLLFQRNIFPGMSIVITKDAQQKYFPFINPDKKIIHDFELLIKSCRDNSFYVIDMVLCFYRIHENQNIGFDKNFIQNKKDNKNSIYLKFKNINWINNKIATFNLDKNLETIYKEKCRTDYQKFIKTLPFPKNLITHLKFKYYYKILNDLS